MRDRSGFSPERLARVAELADLALDDAEPIAAAVDDLLTQLDRLPPATTDSDEPPQALNPCPMRADEVLEERTWSRRPADDTRTARGFFVTTEDRR